MAKLTDFVGITFTNEGPTPCLAMVLKIWTSKTRRQGSSARPKYAAAMRHKVLEACPISAFAVYLFSRWHFGSEGLPDFSDHHKWYDIYACTGKIIIILLYYSKQDLMAKAFPLHPNWITEVIMSSCVQVSMWWALCRRTQLTRAVRQELMRQICLESAKIKSGALAIGMGRP